MFFFYLQSMMLTMCNIGSGRDGYGAASPPSSIQNTYAVLDFHVSFLPFSRVEIAEESENKTPCHQYFVTGIPSTYTPQHQPIFAQAIAQILGIHPKNIICKANATFPHCYKVFFYESLTDDMIKKLESFMILPDINGLWFGKTQEEIDYLQIYNKGENSTLLRFLTNTDKKS